MNAGRHRKPLVAVEKISSKSDCGHWPHNEAGRKGFTRSSDVQHHAVTENTWHRKGENNGDDVKYLWTNN
jgi:hypothetical protein